MTNIVILTGADFSAESGIAPLHMPGDGWDDRGMEWQHSAEAFVADRYRVHGFFDARRARLKAIEPGAAHIALASLEKQWHRQRRGEITIITQNVDNLHERAGSTSVLHIEGELASARCESCGRRFPWHHDLPVGQNCPVCAEPALRPDVVLSGEIPLYRYQARKLSSRADIFVVIGTSGVAEPAVELIKCAAANGAITIEINARLSGNPAFRRAFEGLAVTQVPPLAETLVNQFQATA